MQAGSLISSSSLSPFVINPVQLTESSMPLVEEIIGLLQCTHAFWGSSRSPICIQRMPSLPRFMLTYNSVFLMNIRCLTASCFTDFACVFLIVVSVYKSSVNSITKGMWEEIEHFTWFPLRSSSQPFVEFLNVLWLAAESVNMLKVRQLMRASTFLSRFQHSHGPT